MPYLGLVEAVGALVLREEELVVVARRRLYERALERRISADVKRLVHYCVWVCWWGLAGRRSMNEQVEKAARRLRRGGAQRGARRREKEKGRGEEEDGKRGGAEWIGSGILGRQAFTLAKRPVLTEPLELSGNSSVWSS